MVTSVAFARKYRPKKFSDVLGQDHVTRALKNAFARNTSHHAYLFAGTRGVGKTTLARLCAKLVNCSNKTAEQEPCLQCSSCLQIDLGTSLNYFEMDGASNNGVEHIRQLVDAIQYLPVDAPKKVYVIDEVHMLSQSAFNALLKTLEEPPAHVMFIFATTEVHKIPETILSRCLRFDLRSLSNENIANHLKQITKLEEIKVDKESTLNSLAHYARGSVRDALNILEQVMALSINKTLSDDLVALSLGRLQNSQVSKLLDLILNADAEGLNLKYQEIIKQNVDLESFCLQLHEEAYNLLLKNSHQEIFWLYEQMTKDFQWGLKSLNPEKVIHAILLKITLRHTFVSEHSEIVIEKKSELTADDLWNQVHQYLLDASAAAASTWAHTWGEIKNGTIVLYYKKSDEFLVENFLTGQWWEKAKNLILQKLNQNPSMLKFETSVVNITAEEASGKKNILDRTEEEKRQKNEQVKTEILQSHGVRQIEAIFNAKVDKVQLK